jgi:hypothetical protein
MKYFWSLQKAARGKNETDSGQFIQQALPEFRLLFCIRARISCFCRPACSACVCNPSQTCKRGSIKRQAVPLAVRLISKKTPFTEQKKDGREAF